MNTDFINLTKPAAPLLLLILLCFSGCAETQDTSNGGTQDTSNGGIQDPSNDEPAPKIKWIRSYSEGLLLAKAESKPVFIDFYADWCPPCQQMDKNTFPDTQVIAELQRFVPIKMDLTRRDSPGQPAAKEYNVVAIPTYVFIDTQGKKKVITGYRSPADFLKILKAIE